MWFVVLGVIVLLGFVAFFLVLRCPVITGTIGSGKSTVVAIIQQMNPSICFIDSDKIARDILEPDQPAYKQVLAQFGPSVLAHNNQIDRKKLAETVFADSTKRKALNRVTHHRVFIEIFARLIKARLTGQKVLVDMPLFFEAFPRNFRFLFSPKILVFCDERKKIDRVMRRDGVDENSVRMRLSAQISDSQKIPLSDIVIDNSGTLEDLQREVSHKIVSRLCFFCVLYFFWGFFSDELCISRAGSKSLGPR